MKKLFLSLLITFFAIGCIGPQFVPIEVIPTKPGVGYSWWKDAPSHTSRDCIEGNFGLIDGFIVKDGFSIVVVVKMDNPQDGLDGECDDIVIMVEAGSNNRYGPGTPTYQVIGTAPCDQWDEIKKGMLEIKQNSV